MSVRDFSLVQRNDKERNINKRSMVLVFCQFLRDLTRVYICCINVASMLVRMQLIENCTFAIESKINGFHANFALHCTMKCANIHACERVHS